MRIFSIFRKDLKAFFRDIRSFSLLFLTPVMLVLIIGISFLNTTPSNVKIIVCTLEENNIVSYMDGALRDNSVFLVEKIRQNSVEECRSLVEQKILYGSYRAGVIIPRSVEYQASNIELVVDNSKLVSEYINSYFRILTNDLSQKITKGYMDLIFSNIDEVKKNLTEVENKLGEERQQLQSVRQNLVSARSTLATIKTSLQSGSGSINLVGGSIDNSINSVDTASTNIASSVSRIDTAISLLNAANMSDSDRFLVREELSATRSSLSAQNIALSGIRQRLTSAKTDLNTGQSVIGSISLDSSINGIDSSIQTIDLAVENIDFALEKFRLLRIMIQSSDINRPNTVQFVNAETKNIFENNRFIDFLFPSTVLMVIMILSIFLASVTFIRQRATGLIHRMSIVPHGIRLIITERLLLVVFLSIIALPVLILVGIFILFTNLTLLNILLLIGCGITTSLIFASFGLIIASLSRYESTAILLAIFITLPMIFLSGILVPLERMPQEVSAVAGGLPLNICIKMFESVNFYSFNMEAFINYGGSLLAYFLVSFLLAWVFIKRDLKG